MARGYEAVMSIADGILATGYVLGLLSPYVLMATGRLHTCDCNAVRSAPVADEAPAVASPQPAHPALPEPAVNGSSQRVFDPAARPRPRDQYGRLVSKERLAELAANNSGEAV
jgi:hypothetical protein